MDLERASKETDLLLPPPIRTRTRAQLSSSSTSTFPLVRSLVAATFIYGCALWVIGHHYLKIRADRGGDLVAREDRYRWGTFHATVKTQKDLCPDDGGVQKISRSGYIGLLGDSESAPRRSFYWFFQSQHDSDNAPLILTHGGGPGTSGLMNPLLAQSHCTVLANGTLISNPYAWTEKYNLLALDHPLGAGFSIGEPPNSSAAAAVDVYDFLQKFYVLNPQLTKNKLILASGSYGGVYIPHIATEIHQQNLALQAGHGIPGAQHINLESMMVSNPLSDTLSHFRWLLDSRCQNPIFNVYNATQCDEAYKNLPECLDAIQYALDFTTAETRFEALRTCNKAAPEISTNRSLENVKVECDASLEGCVPEIVGINDYLNHPGTKEMLGVPDNLTWAVVNKTVYSKFYRNGDLVRRAHLLYGPLVSGGIRLLHYVGKLDANCGWQGIYHFLKYIPTPFREAFINATDVAWPPDTKDVATVRAVGDPGSKGSGNFTWLLMNEAGHLVVKDQPALVKQILEHWVDDRAWF